VAVTIYGHFSDTLPTDIGDYAASNPQGFGTVDDGSLANFIDATITAFPTAESYATILWDWGELYDTTKVELWGRVDHQELVISEFGEYVIEASDDHVSWTTLQSETIAETGFGVKREWNGNAQARYIRMYFHCVVTGDNPIPAFWPAAISAINEVEVTGTPVDGEEPCEQPPTPTLTYERVGSDILFTFAEGA
jgi:hypothetical protein